MSEPTQSNENEWMVADLNEKERKFELPLLTDETPIVRYVQLSTLFLYLSDRAFIPSLELLRRMDPFEGTADAASLLLPEIRLALDSLFEQHRGFLRSNPVFEPTHPARQTLGADSDLYLLSWTNELVKRRVVWCWNLFENESNAMWKLYGFKGVAIKSTIGDLKKALANSGCSRRLIASVRYNLPYELLSWSAGNFAPSNKATWPSWFMRPYVCKQPAYRYEQESRFVFGVHPKITKLGNGVLVELDGKTLIGEVLFSDSIQKDERAIIRELFKKIKNCELPSPIYPPIDQDLWQQRFNLIQGPPFTLQDDYPELFPDLTDYS